MTVINAMKFNENEAAMVADEQVSYGGRKSDLVRKVRRVDFPGGFALMGGTGLMDHLHEVGLHVDRTAEQVGVTTGHQLAEHTGRIMRDVKRKEVDAILQSKWGITELELQAGVRLVEGQQIPIRGEIMQAYDQFVSGHEYVNDMNGSRFLILAQDQTGIGLCTVTGGSSYPTIISRNFATAGSGTDMGDEELTRFMSKYVREERENIDRLDGLTALLLATDRAGKRNAGVGGAAYIYIVQEGKVIEPVEDSCRLATEIARGYDWGCLPDGFRREALGNLLYRGADFDAVDRAMWKFAAKRGQRTRFNRLLRSYRV